jgi:hypothetical protein
LKSEEKESILGFPGSLIIIPSHPYEKNFLLLHHSTLDVPTSGILKNRVVAISGAVWEISHFRHLLQRHLASEVLGAGQEMMIEAASSTSMCTPGKHNISHRDMMMLACIMSLLKIVDQNLALE